MCDSAHTDHVSTWKLFEYEIKPLNSIHFTMGKAVNRKKEKKLKDITLCLLKKCLKVDRKMYSIIKSNGSTAQI